MDYLKDYQLIKMPDSFNRIMFKAVCLADNFKDRLAIYRKNDESNYIINLKKIPTEKQFELIRLSFYKPVQCGIDIYVNGKLYKSTKCYTFKELLDQRIKNDVKLNGR